MGPQTSSDDSGKTIEAVNGSYQKLTLNHFYDTTKPDATHDNPGPRMLGTQDTRPELNQTPIRSSLREKLILYLR